MSAGTVSSTVSATPATAHSERLVADRLHVSALDDSSKLSGDTIDVAQTYCIIGLTHVQSALHDSGTAVAVAAALEAAFEQLFEDAVNCHVQRGRSETSRTWRDGRLICRDVQVALRRGRLSALLAVESVKLLADQFMDSATASALGLRAPESESRADGSAVDGRHNAVAAPEDDGLLGETDGDGREDLESSHASVSLSASTLGGSGTRAQWNKRHARGPFSPPVAGAEAGTRALSEREVALLLKRVHCAYSLANDALTFALALGRELLRLSGVGGDSQSEPSGGGVAASSASSSDAPVPAAATKGSLAWLPAAVGDRASAMAATLLAALSGSVGAGLPPSLPVRFTLLQGCTARGSWTTSIPRAEPLHQHLEAACRQLQLHADTGGGASGSVSLSSMVPLWGWTQLEGTLSPADYGMVAYPAGVETSASGSRGGDAASDGTAAAAVAPAAVAQSSMQVQVQVQPVRVWLMPRPAFEHLRREEARRGILTGAAGVTSSSLRSRQTAMKALRDGAASRVDCAPPATALAASASAAAAAAASAETAAASAMAAVARLRKGEGKASADADSASAHEAAEAGAMGAGPATEGSRDHGSGHGRGRGLGQGRGRMLDGSGATASACASASASASPAAPRNRASLSPADRSPRVRSPAAGHAGSATAGSAAGSAVGSASIASPGRHAAPLSVGASPARASGDHSEPAHPQGPAHAPTYRPVPASAATRLPMLAPAKMAALIAPHVGATTAAMQANASIAPADGAGESMGSGLTTASVSPAASSGRGVTLPPAPGSARSGHHSPRAAATSSSASSSASASASASGAAGPAGAVGSASPAAPAGPTLHPLVWAAVRIAAGADGQPSSSSSVAADTADSQRRDDSNVSGGDQLDSVIGGATTTTTGQHLPALPAATVAPPPSSSSASAIAAAAARSAAVAAAAELARPSSAAARTRLIKTPLVGWRAGPGTAGQAAAATGGLRSTGGFGAMSRTFGEHDPEALAMMQSSGSGGSSSDIVAYSFADGSAPITGGGATGSDSGAGGAGMVPVYGVPDLSRLQALPPASSRPDFGRRFRDAPAIGPRHAAAVAGGALPPLPADGSSSTSASAPAAAPGKRATAAGAGQLKPAPPAGAATARERRAPRLLGKADASDASGAAGKASLGKPAEDLLSGSGSGSGSGSPGRAAQQHAVRPVRVSAPPAASNRRGSAASAATGVSAGAGTGSDAVDTDKGALTKAAATPRKPAVPGRRVAASPASPSPSAAATAATGTAAATSSALPAAAPAGQRSVPPSPPTVSLASAEGRELARKGSAVAPALRSAADTLASLGAASDPGAGSTDTGTGTRAAADGSRDAEGGGGSSEPATVDLSALRDALTTARAAAGDMLTAVDHMLHARGHGHSSAPSVAHSAAALHGRSKVAQARSRASRSPRADASRRTEPHMPASTAAASASSTQADRNSGELQPVALAGPPNEELSHQEEGAANGQGAANEATAPDAAAAAASERRPDDDRFGNDGHTAGDGSLRPGRKGTITSTAAIAPGIGFRTDSSTREL